MFNPTWRLIFISSPNLIKTTTFLRSFIQQVKYKQNYIWSVGAFNYFYTSACYLSARDGPDIDNYVLHWRSLVICNNKLKIWNYNKKKLFFRWQACTNKPTNIFHKTLNQISVRVQLQTMHYSRHITRVLLCLYLFICMCTLFILGMCRSYVEWTICFCLLLFLDLIFNGSGRRFVILGLRFTFLQERQMIYNIW